MLLRDSPDVPSTLDLILAGRSEIWAAANVLAPIMMLEAMALPGNRITNLSLSRYNSRTICYEHAHSVGAAIPAHTLFSDTTMEGPVEKFLAYLVGNAWKQQGMFIVYALIALAVYLLLFMVCKTNAEEKCRICCSQKGLVN